jgi:hypothetical protein
VSYFRYHPGIFQERMRRETTKHINLDSRSGINSKSETFLLQFQALSMLAFFDIIVGSGELKSVNSVVSGDMFFIQSFMKIHILYRNLLGNTKEGLIFSYYYYYTFRIRSSGLFPSQLIWYSIPLWPVTRNPWTGDQPVARPLHTRDNTNREETGTDIHASSGNRSQNPSAHAGEDISCLRPRGHCDRGLSVYLKNSFYCEILLRRIRWKYNSR